MYILSLETVSISRIEVIKDLITSTFEFVILTQIKILTETIISRDST